MNESLCLRLREMLAEQLQFGFDQDLNALLKARGRDLWIIEIDPKKQELRDICGNIDAAVFEEKIRRRFVDSSAGFRADAHIPLNITTASADAFMLRSNFLDSADEILKPLVVHELAHYFSQIGEVPAATDADKGNAGAILISLRGEIRKIPDHNHCWAQHVAVAARRLVAHKHTTYPTIREFAEAAVPRKDRKFDRISILE